MGDTLASFLTQRPEDCVFILPSDFRRALNDLFRNPDALLPAPYKIYFSDEEQYPTLGFPVAQTPALDQLEAKLDKWLGEEIEWQIRRVTSKERAQQAFESYVSHAMRLAENAMVSTLLADYHGVFWLAHSMQLARHFSAIPRRISVVDPAAGRQQGDHIKYRIFTRWGYEMREQVTRIAVRLRPVLDGEEERGVQFFRILHDNILILTEEFISPDLREMRSFVTGHLHRDFQLFRSAFHRVQNLTNELLQSDPTFRAAVQTFGLDLDQGLPLGLLLNARFQRMLFALPKFDAVIGREEREQIESVSRRLAEFNVLHLLRRGITWMRDEDGEVISADRRGVVYSKSTRPIDFGRPGVVDPMVYRFGLMYDIAAFSETLGNIARSGQKGEMSSYRQMVLFQKKIEAIAQSHRLQFEKFLGDGAFYTTRRALRLIRAAIEFQRFYADTRRKGFAFSRGMRIALNYGYYRLLPMKGSPDSNERVMEFYGPGIVELSRLTTGKASKEIEEIQQFLVAHGYDPAKVHEFFAPLERGADMVDHRMHEREFYAYLNANGHLVNEGIAASWGLIEQLAHELVEESRPLHRLTSRIGNYVGFDASIGGTEWVGIRRLGRVSLKGLDQIDVAEVVAFEQGEAQAGPQENDSLLVLLRQIYNEQSIPGMSTSVRELETRERELRESLVLCALDGPIGGSLYVLGLWEPSRDRLRQTVRLTDRDLESEGFTLPVGVDSLRAEGERIRQLYAERIDSSEENAVSLEPFRGHGQIFLLAGDVEEL